MTPEEKLAELVKEAAALRAKAKSDADFTEADAARAETLAAEHSEVTAILAKKYAAATALSQFAGAGQEFQANEFEGGQDDGSRVIGLSRSGPNKRGALSLDTSRTNEFTKAIMQAFKAAGPQVGGPFVEKALVSSGSLTSGFSGVIVSDPKQQPSLLNVVPSVSVTDGKGQFLQQSVRTSNAATVAMQAVKPKSVFTLTPKDWEMCTVAHLTEPIAKQLIDDYQGLTDFLTSELAYGLDLATTGLLLNGGTSENGNPVDGILTTTGIVEDPYATSALMTIRNSIGELEKLGVTPSHIVLNPDDWKAIDVTLDQQNWAQGGTPLEAPVRRLWSVPVIVDASMPAGKAIVGDLYTVQWLFRQSMELTWNAYNAGDAAAARDMFQRNEIQFRAELRTTPVIGSVKTIRISDLTAV